jgi:SET domain-containing protein
MEKKGKRTGKFVPGAYALRVRRSTAGLGLYADEAIPKGACIIEYFGRTITNAEAYTSRSRYLFEISKTKTIDGTQRDNTARYVNHSCAPNCEVEIYKGRIFIMALRAIKKGEELSYDYGEEYVDEHIKPMGCRCPARKHHA